ncbi:MAG: 4Fe-4S binding protein [Candidatus Altiarchaeota archaeon]
MTRRKIIRIDERKCNGCGQCIPNCPEGALQVIDGKARLISDLFCDGLGACIGHCPEGAINVIEREAQPYDESKVMENIIKAGPNTIKAHLDHLREHGEHKYLKEAITILNKKNIKVPTETHTKHHGGCPGARMMDFSESKVEQQQGDTSSQLRQWPVQLHLVNPNAPYYQGNDVLLSADCVAYALGDFHTKHLKGKSLAIACPKLDEEQETYVEKLTAMIDEARINTLTVMTMEVPCCSGLLHLAKQATEQAKRKIPVKSIIVGINGDILQEDWT